MSKADIYLVTYKGQTESPYTWAEDNYNAAVNLMADLKIEYPDREWSVNSKDVS